MIFQTCAGAKGFRKWFVTMAGAICPRGVVDEKWAFPFFGTEEVVNSLHKRTEIEIFSHFADFQPEDFVPAKQLLDN